MNEDGLMIISEDPIDINQDFLLRIDLPEDIYSMSVLNFDARSVWCKLDVDPNFYNTGFQLDNVSDESKDIIVQIIEDYGFRD
jgi:hypothetical protein